MAEKIFVGIKKVVVRGFTAPFKIETEPGRISVKVLWSASEKKEEEAVHCACVADVLEITYTAQTPSNIRKNVAIGGRRVSGQFAGSLHIQGARIEVSKTKQNITDLKMTILIPANTEVVF